MAVELISRNWVTYARNLLNSVIILKFAKMTTHFITAEIDLQETPVLLRQEIEAELQKRGEPLRWAVTCVDTQTHKAQVEAIVTAESDSKTAL